MIWFVYFWFVKKEKAEKVAAHDMKREKNEVNAELSGQGKHVNPEKERSRTTLHLVESLALVMLCSCKPIIRKQAVIILKEVRKPVCRS